MDGDHKTRYLERQPSDARSSARVAIVALRCQFISVASVGNHGRKKKRAA